jgi:hypothetical protein
MRSTFPTYAFDSLSISAVARSVLNSPPRCCGEDQCLKPVARLTKSKVFGFPEPLLPFRPFSLQDHRPIQFHLRGLPFAKRPISVRSPTAERASSLSRSLPKPSQQQSKRPSWRRQRVFGPNGLSYLYARPPECRICTNLVCRYRQFRSAWVDGRVLTSSRLTRTPFSPVFPIPGTLYMSKGP